jgi:3-phosphoshikimate 1-carboxyvinyltransferase
MDITIQPVRRLEGEISLPGDKSISHRAIILGGIARGKSRIEHFLPSRDCMSTFNCMRALGVKIHRVDETTLEVGGAGRGGLKEPGDVLDSGNSGTTMRLLSGLLAGQPFFSVLTGDGSLRQRPMKRVVEPLQRMGAYIFGRDQDAFAPLAIKGGHLTPIDHTMKVASAQVKSAILLAGLYAHGQTVVREPASSRDHTERMLQCMGKDMQTKNLDVCIEGGGQLEAGQIAIPGDISSAAYFLVAATIARHSRLLIEGVGLNPTRTGILETLKRMGAKLDIGHERIISNEPIADIEVQAAELRGIQVSGKMIPRMIDELPILAVAATQAQGTTVIQDAAELRVKETDRIRSMASELSKMGAHIEAKEDGWVIEGPTPLQGARCWSQGDHRMAMSMAVAGLIARGETHIQGAECIDISFPGFSATIEKIAHR